MFTKKNLVSLVKKAQNLLKFPFFYLAEEVGRDKSAKKTCKINPMENINHHNNTRTTRPTRIVPEGGKPGSVIKVNLSVHLLSNTRCNFKSVLGSSFKMVSTLLEWG